jgi:predicted DNA-binding protein (MmcQ/YjbR family)
MPLDWPSTGPDDPLHRRTYERALKRVRAFCLSLPGGAEKISRGHMPVFTSRGKNFAIVARAEARPSLWIAAEAGAQQVLVEAEQQRYYRPPYVGGRGWVGAWLDVDVDWAVLEQLLRDGHALVVAARGRKLDVRGQ